jgi:hypothetical protein
MATIPSLALIPSGYKASKVYSVLPTDGTGDFDFTRSGNATRVNSEGLIELVTTNVPRLNYPLIDGVVNGCPSLLLEPQRTNLALYSEQFDNAGWTKTGATITANTTTSPDGYVNADKLVEDTNTGGHLIQKILTVSAATVYTISVFVKYAGREWIRFTDAQSSNRIHFNTLTGVFGTTSGTVIDYNSTTLGDGWYKLSLTTTSVGTAYAPRITLAEADNDVTYTGDGTSGVYIYGASLEQGSYATSYIPTLGASVTRSAETCNNAGDVNTFNSSEGVLFAEISALADDSDSKRITISDGTLANRITISVSDNIVSGFINVNNVSQYTFYESNQNVLSPIKIAVKYKANDFAIWISGVEYDASTSGTTFPPSTLTQLSFDNAVGANVFYGNVKDLQVFTTALTDAELIALTTI